MKDLLSDVRVAHKFEDLRLSNYKEFLKILNSHREFIDRTIFLKYLKCNIDQNLMSNIPEFLCEIVFICKVMF